MDELSPSSTPSSRPPPRLPPSVATTVDLNSDDSEKKAIRQRRLSFGIPDTPAASTDEQAAQIGGLMRTISELENSARLAQADNERLIARIPAPAAAAGSSGQATDAALAELTSKLNSLTEVVSALAERQARPEKKAKETRTAVESGSDSDPDFSSDSDSDSDADKTVTMRETGPACVSVFCRSMDYSITDPDRISERHDVDGVDSDYRRISDKRPLILSDLADNTDKRGSQLKEVAARLLKRISKGLKPQPSPQSAIGLSIFAMHDKLDEVVRCRLQSAIMAARNCSTSRDVKNITRTCLAKRRVPSALLQRAMTISDSPLIKAVKTEAAKGGTRLIRSVWDLIVTVLSMDRNPAVTLSSIQAKWKSLEGGDVEAALFHELSLYDAAVDLLGTNKGAKPFCSFEDRVTNILRCRTTDHCDVKHAFDTRLELDQLDLIDLDWDDVWDRVIDAEAAAARKHKGRNHRPPSQDPPPTDHIVMTCILHGQCGHETPACKTLNRYPDLPESTIRILKHNHICVIGYGEKHPQGECGRQDCKFKHVTPDAAAVILTQPLQLAHRPSSLIAHPAIEAPPILGSAAHPLPAQDDDMFASYAVIGYPGEED